MNCKCDNTQAGQGERRGGLISTMFKLVLLYAVLVLTGGTLINTGNPIAYEVGQLIHVLTFVDHLGAWANGHGLTFLAGGLDALQGGLPLDWVGRYT
jgi:hypothetical protein